MTLKDKQGKLYIVATSIGHKDDITLRAINTLKEVDVVICEEHRIGQRLLKSYSIDKPLMIINEHNEREEAEKILVEAMTGKDFALISDCGTPIFSDPGRHLINVFTEMGLKVIPIPGVSSLITAISVCKFDLRHFLFVGFLSPKSELRTTTLENYKKMNHPLILMDTPYRLTKTLEDVLAVFGKNQAICLACDLTLPSEMILHSTIEDTLKRFNGLKKEFILIIDKPLKRNFA